MKTALVRVRILLLLLAKARPTRHARRMSGSLTVAVAREGRIARLAGVTCTLGRHAKPYPEVHASEAWIVALVRRGTFGYRAASTKRVHPCARAGSCWASQTRGSRARTKTTPATSARP
jgi:hypothetical protein